MDLGLPTFRTAPGSRPGYVVNGLLSRSSVHAFLVSTLSAVALGLQHVKSWREVGELVALNAVALVLALLTGKDSERPVSPPAPRGPGGPGVAYAFLLGLTFLALAGTACATPPYDPPPVPPAPVPVPTPPTPDPMPQPANPVAASVFDAVTLGMTEAELVKAVGVAPWKRVPSSSLPGAVSLLWHIRQTDAAAPLLVLEVWIRNGVVVNKLRL